MADAVTEITLDALHAAIETAIKAAFPDLQTVEFYRDDRGDHIPVPACLLELTEFENTPTDDAGTGQIAMNARFEARFILGFKTPKVKLEARKLAAAFAAWLKLRRWPGVPTDEAQVIGAYPDDFAPELDKYEVWRVEWQQLVFLGESAWKNDGVPVTTVFIGFAPNTGPEHIQDYVQLVP
jgi:hypothetical protein